MSHRLVRRLVTIAGVLIACALGLSILAAPVERIVLIVPDDAFYYLQIARNLIARGQSTADGFSATNGYHPLWLAIVTTMAAVIEDRELLVRAAVGASLVMHLVASWLIGARITQVAGRAWGWTAGVCWLLNRVAFLVAMHAMESMLYVVSLLVAFGVHMRVAAALKAIESTAATMPISMPMPMPMKPSKAGHARPGETAPRRLLMLYGASLGLACLARTEGAIVAIVALAWLGGRLWRTSRGSSARAGVAASWAIAAATLALIVLPWLLFSLWQVGTIAQDSGAMKALWAADHFPDAASRVGNVLDTVNYFLIGSVRLMWYSLPLPAIALVPLALAAAVIGAHAHSPRSRTATAMRVVVIPATVVVGVYGWTLVERQLWWLGLPWLAIFLTGILATVWLCRAIPALRRRQHIVRGAMVAASMLSFIALARAPMAPYPWQADLLRSQLEIERSIPQDQRIGCFNAGIPLYFGTGRVVALDGLVSHAARGYWAERRVDDYLRDANVRFIADERLGVGRAERFARRPFQLEERRTFPLRDWPTGTRVLWAVKTDN